MNDRYDGFESVFVFFMISGFLIASNSLARWGTLAAIDAKAFYRRRAARILPCLSILVAVLCGLALAGDDLRTGVAWYLPVLACAWALGRTVARFISEPLERLVLRASASRMGAAARVLPTEVSA